MKILGVITIILKNRKDGKFCCIPIGRLFDNGEDVLRIKRPILDKFVKIGKISKKSERKTLR